MYLPDARGCLGVWDAQPLTPEVDLVDREAAELCYARTGEREGAEEGAVGERLDRSWLIGAAGFFALVAPVVVDRRRFGDTELCSDLLPGSSFGSEDGRLLPEAEAPVRPDS